MELDDNQLDAFRSLILREGAKHYRNLPWRNIDDPYLVLVSEVMLQQTQVARVLKRWSRFIETFPSIDALASAETSLVLELWQGLGYNRRALALKRCAEICSTEYAGALPTTGEALQRLPGIGPATASGVLAFAYQQPCVYLETNVRSVFLHHFFRDQDAVTDRELAPIVEHACPRADVRAWYYALLDYGAYLKTQVPNPSRRSASYTKQSAFEGSRRQKRALIVRLVLGDPGISRESLRLLVSAEEEKAGREAVEHALADELIDELVSEGFFSERDGGFYA